MITTVILICITAILMTISFFKSREKTREVFKNSKKTFTNIVTEIIGILLILGLILALVPKDVIAYLLGGNNKILSTLYGALIGAITIIPGVIAFPLSKELYTSGASLMAIAAFITTLTMVGFATVPIETKFFGKKFTYTRGILSFLAAIIIALLMGVLL